MSSLSASALDALTTVRPQMTALADLVRSFAALLTPPSGGNAELLTSWITEAHDVDPPHCTPSPAASTTT